MSIKDHDRLPRVKLPGLQIFPNGYFSRSNSAVTQGKLSTHDSWSSSSPRIPLDTDNQIRKLSDWGIEHLNDSSPTVVDSSDFCEEELKAFFQEKAREEWANQETKISELELLVPQIFAESPLSSSRFVEEFQYTIIASQLLADSVRSNFKLPISQQSILDFRKEVRSTDRWYSPTPTKFGLLSVKDKGFELRKTIPFLPTILLSHRCLNALAKSRQRNIGKSRVFAVIAIGVYLALQQEYFHSQYLQYSTLITLKSAIKYLQELDGLLNRFQMHYKELTVYKPIALVQSSKLQSSRLPVIRDILTASLDMLFYQLKQSVAGILPVINLRELKNCCAIYNLNTVDLFYAISCDSQDLLAKSKRVSLLKKFTLCCLLSINENLQDNSEDNQELERTLQKVFINYENLKWVPRNKKFSTIQKNLCTINSSLKVILMNLREYKYEIYAGDNGPLRDVDSEDPQNVNYQTIVTLNKLKELESFLLSQNDSEEAVRSSVFDELRGLLKFWQPRSENKTKQWVKHRKDRHFSGLNFDIVKSPHLSNSEFNHDSEQSNFNRALDSPVQFNVINDSDSDLEKENGEHISEQVYSSQTTHGDNSSSYRKEKFNKMTDEQLRQKLNERIMHMAMENKLGKDKLRTKKSFELLNNDVSFQESRACKKVKSRTFHETAYMSEESIPVLYELKQLLENK